MILLAIIAILKLTEVFICLCGSRRKYEESFFPSSIYTFTDLPENLWGMKQQIWKRKEKRASARARNEPFAARETNTKVYLSRTFKTDDQSGKVRTKVFPVKFGPNMCQGIPGPIIITPPGPRVDADIFDGVLHQVWAIAFRMRPFHQIRAFAHGMEPEANRKERQIRADILPRKFWLFVQGTFASSNARQRRVRTNNTDLEQSQWEAPFRVHWAWNIYTRCASPPTLKQRST